MKRYNRLYYFLFLLFFTFLPRNTAQATLPPSQNSAKFFRMSTDWGLSNSSVNSILQDKKGFLWFGTMNGLNKYDGYSFEIFKNIPHDSSSLSGNRITALMLDSSGRIWIGTEDRGINIYNPLKNNFLRIKYDSKNKNSISSDRITSLAEDKNGFVWIGTDGGGINRLDKRTKKIRRYFPGGPGAAGLSDSHISTIILAEGDDVLWIGTAFAGLNRLYLKNNTIKVYRFVKEDPCSLSSDNIASLCMDSSGTLWVGTDRGGLNRFNKGRDNFTRIESSRFGSKPKIDWRILSLYQDSQGLLWIGTWGEGLVSFDYDSNKIRKFKHSRLDWKSLSSNRVLSIFEDRSGLLWVGTDRGGFCIYDRLQNEFSIISNETFETFNEQNGAVQAAIEDRQGYLWVGTDTGLERINRSTGEVTKIFKDESRQQSYDYYDIKTLFEDTDGSIWIGTKNNGLIKYHKSTGRFTSFKNDPANPGSLSHNHVSAIFRDKSGSLWVGTFGGGLDLFLEDKGEFRHQKHDPDERFSLSNDCVLTILEDNESQIWVGTSGGGLNKFDRENVHFLPYKRQPGNKESIGSNVIYDMIEDKRGNLWLGGSAGGLNKFDKKGGNFIKYTDKGYLENDEIFNVLEDDKGNIWLGTNKRLAKFDPKTGKFLYYDTYYWLDKNEIVSQCAFKSKGGELLFGGIKGISCFYPEKLSEIDEVPILLISSILVNDQPVYSFEYDPKTGIKMLRLAYYKNKISFTFFIIDFRVPDNNRYSYKLEGSDDKWEYQGNLEYLQYDELSPGKYTFIVRGANHYGIWNNEGDAIRIIIATPFWGTIWFKALLIISFIGLILGLYKWRTFKINRQKSELEKRVAERTQALQVKQRELMQAREFLKIQVEERTKELKQTNIELENEIKERELAEAERRSLEKQLYESQKMESIGRLAGGIAHDFNNILSIIMGYADLLKLRFADTGSNVGKAVDAVLTNTRRARDLVNQLLGFARGGKYKPVPISINNAIRGTINVCEKIFEKKIKVKYDFDERIHPCLADKSQIDQVLTNLIINASDAMPNGGEIVFKTENLYLDKHSSTKYPDLKPGTYVKSVISDTGIGIPENIIDKVFEPFFTTKGRAEGTGLGLATVYGIVKNHQGYIDISSKPGIGTNVTVLLPACEQDVVERGEEMEICSGEGSLLIIDDEQDILSMIKEQLLTLGYKVYLAEDGSKALEVCRQKKHQIDLVLLDMIMPEMSGKDTFFALKKVDPDLKVILISGFSKGDEATELLNSGAEDFIQKPISLSELSRKIFQILKKSC